MPDGGTLTISTSRGRGGGRARPRRRATMSAIAVADTGQGMTAEVAARATEPFFSTKPLGKGTGLGLAQVYGIVRQSGGTMRIESREGEGTIVRLLLPHAPAPTPRRTRRGESRAGADGRRAAAGGARILVVDDDRGRARIPRRRAARPRPPGRDARRRRGGAGGAGRAARPTSLLVDFAMPGMNGAELARALRAAPSRPADRLRHRLRRERPARRRARRRRAGAAQAVRNRRARRRRRRSCAATACAQVLNGRFRFLNRRCRKA